MKTLHISAGGQGKRIEAYTSSVKPLLPKHLLPLPTKGRTILGEIVVKAQEWFEEIKIWSSKENHPQIKQALEAFAATKVEIDVDMTGPLGPTVRNLLSTSSRTYGCAGDFYCDFSWSEFEKFHNKHGLPISILVSRSAPTPKGARFHLNDDVITSWERVDQTTAEDRINIGCYIIDPVSEVVSRFKSMQKHKEDVFFDLFVPMELVAGYNPGVPSFNINVVEVYENLLSTLMQDSVEQQRGG